MQYFRFETGYRSDFCILQIYKFIFIRQNGTRDLYDFKIY